VFRTEVVPRLASLSSHTSLYVNAGDKALAASKLVHGSKPRAGAVPIEADGLDTIDATTVGTDMLGHAYFGSVPALLRDIQATWTGTPVPERDWLDRDHTHWTFHAE
jgi:esterase/lipase superfamily enzyme